MRSGQQRAEQKLTRYFGRYTVEDNIAAIEAAPTITGMPQAPTLYLDKILPAGQARAGEVGWFKFTVEFEPSRGKDRTPPPLTEEDLLRVIEQSVVHGDGSEAFQLHGSRMWGTDGQRVTVFRLKNGDYRLYGTDEDGKKDATLAKGTLVDVLRAAKERGFL